MSATDAFVFLRAWLQAPRHTGALAPSGPALARLMTARIDHLDGPVIELGPGTGVFTRALFERGIPVHRLALIEANPIFAQALARRYPAARVLRMDAQFAMRSPLFADEKASAVISGLPLLSMPREQVANIVHDAFEHQLNETGVFYQFTYGLRCPLPKPLLERLNLEAVRVGTAWFNFPPASVYRISRSNHTQPLPRHWQEA